MPELRYRDLKPGDPAPWFHQRCTSNERYAFDTVGGRWVLMCFFGAVAAPWSAARLNWTAAAARARFDDERLSLFGVSVDARDERERRIGESLPGIRQIWDVDGRVSQLYGALPLADGEVPAAPADGPAAPEALQSLAAGRYRPRWVLLNPALQVRAVLPFAAGAAGAEGAAGTAGAADAADASGAAELPALAALLDALPPLDQGSGIELHAPIIVVPDVFEPALCEALIGQYEAAGGEASGFMREEAGLTVGVHDSRHKVRRDHLLGDERLCTLVQRRIVGRVVPMVQRAHQFEATRMERYLVACYDANEGAHFRAHRDNTTKGTAHRRFAVSVNLNADFDGGTLAFPEFGPRRYKPPPGAALVFSCSLLHQVDRVTRGRRFAFLPFLYDEAAAQLRDANRGFLGTAPGGDAATPEVTPVSAPP